MRLRQLPPLLGANRGAFGALLGTALTALIVSSCGGNAEPIHHPPPPLMDGGAAGADGGTDGVVPDGGVDAGRDRAADSTGGGADGAVDQGGEGGGNTVLLADGKS